jgi:ribosomal subunit interface protein
MQIIVSGKQVDVGDSLRTHIENRLQEGLGKYLERVTSVKVVVSRESHMFRIDITGNTGTHSGLVIKSHAEGGDVYGAFDAAADKIEKQLRRYKRRLTNHHKTAAHAEEREKIQALGATKYVLAAQEEEPEHDAPVVIAEKSTQVERLSVSEAVMKMDLADLPALVFVNSSTGRFNVVYRRVDGNISWVDPNEAVEKAA